MGLWGLVRSLVPDLLAIAGAGCALYGLRAFSPPLALIVAGLALMGLGYGLRVSRTRE